MSSQLLYISGTKVIHDWNSHSKHNLTGMPRNRALIGPKYGLLNCMLTADVWLYILLFTIRFWWFAPIVFIEPHWNEFATKVKSNQIKSNFVCLAQNHKNKNRLTLLFTNCTYVTTYKSIQKSSILAFLHSKDAKDYSNWGL